MAQPGDNPLRVPLLVGVDGGATEVKAHVVWVTPDGFVTGDEQAVFRHALVSGFAPRPIDVQLRERDTGRISPGEDERAQAERWIDSFTEAISSVAARAGRVDLLVGACAPGLKSRDGRGIDVARNGPRSTDFLDRLESRLRLEGLALAAPTPALASDGFACGLGEAAHPAGGFRGVANAYYVGGGTGVAECLLLDGRVTSFDDVAGRADKAWSLHSTLGRSFEDHVSMRGLEARFAELSNADVGSERVETAAIRGDPAAIAALTECATMLAELVNSRARAFRVERVVVGQRLGALWSDPALSRCLREPFERTSRVPVRASTLRSAPAIGAARLAWDAWSSANGHTRLAAHG